jgi:hypothetical protein
MPRPRKTSSQWIEDYPDFKLGVTVNNQVSAALVCKYCAISIDPLTSNRTWSRITEHVESSRHKRLKQEFTDNPGKPINPLDIHERQIGNETKCQGAIYDFVRSILYSGQSLELADGPIGDNHRKYVPACKTMPCARQLRRKHQHEIFEEHLNSIVEDMRHEPICLITDESPDLIDEPTQNTLVSYYSRSERKLQLFLVDTQRLLGSASSYTCAVALEKAVQSRIQKKYIDVIAIASDSAPYMIKLVQDINNAHEVSILHIRDLPHLLHVTVISALQSSACKDAMNICVKFGAIFKHAGKLFREFKDICWSEFQISGTKLHPVIPSRWFTHQNCINDVTKFWHCLLSLLDKSKQKGSKLETLRDLLVGSGEKENYRRKIYGILLTLGDILETLKPLRLAMERKFLSVFHCSELVHTTETILGTLSTPDAYEYESEKTKAMLTSCSISERAEIRKTGKLFILELNRKWADTRQRNLPPDSKQVKLFEKSQIFNPAKKSQVSQVFENYVDLFITLKAEITDDLKKEFDSYLTKCDVNVADSFQYWLEAEKTHPSLALAALRCHSIPSGSIDVERTFSKLRYMQRPNRSRASEQSVKECMILFVNKGTVPQAEENDATEVIEESIISSDSED